MASRAVPCPTLLRLLVSVDEDRGLLFWKKRQPWMFSSSKFRSAEQYCETWNRRFAGRPAMVQKSVHGYFCGKLLDRDTKAHRVIFAVHFGRWPIGDIDHLDGNPQNNRLSNLRDVTHAENIANQKLRTDNKYGMRGIKFVKTGKRQKRWTAELNYNGKCIGFQYFSTPEEAAEAYASMRRKLYGNSIRE